MTVTVTVGRDRRQGQRDRGQGQKERAEREGQVKMNDTGGKKNNEQP